MMTLAIDCGTYSVKFYEAQKERRKIFSNNYSEVVIDQVRAQYPEGTSTLQIQQEIIRGYLAGRTQETRVISNVPNSMITSRNLVLPLINKKRVEQMIPFQLDEMLPFPIHSAHVVYQLNKKLKTTNAMINIVRTSEFEQYTAALSPQTRPHALTSELFCINSYASHLTSKGAYCVLDLGHSSSRGYFIFDKEVLTNHSTSFCGKQLDRLISETYQISLDEAVYYKHENCFVLTDEQMSEVDTSQRDFALLMKQAFSTLIQDFKRWDIGFKALYGTGIEKIYVTGGTANIKNCRNFLSDELGIPVLELPMLDLAKNSDQPIVSKDLPSFAMAHLMAFTEQLKLVPPTFFQGQFAMSTSSVIPLHSTVFLLTRTLTISGLLIFALGIESLFLNTKNKNLDKSIMKMLKTPQIAFSKADIVQYKKFPEKTLSKLKQKTEMIVQETTLISSSVTVNALTPLARLSSLLSSNFEIYLEQFSTDGSQVSAIFASEKAEELDAIKKQLTSGGIQASSFETSEDGLKLTVTFLETTL